MRNFQLALRFADAANKTKLEGYVAEFKKRMGNAGERKVLTIKNVEYTFHWCPAGKFQRGDEGDTHQITFSSGFWMLETEVTQSMWLSVMGDNPSSFIGSCRSAFRDCYFESYRSDYLGIRLSLVSESR
ncbi:MAG: hypothetical protein LBI05_07640 [Planctomycetaceae bacterium]|jgi:formylglycine-generating enzyme required for sulfatase activity|nr:hypothetical protein [Planctomycetaceae bacterium]